MWSIGIAGWILLIRTFVPLLKNDQKGIKIITVEEVRRLFPENYRTVWGGKEVAYAANRLASLTGMRAGLVRYAIQFFLRASMRLYKKSG